MLRLSSMIFAALLICGATFAQSDSSSAVDFAQHAAERALNFKQGDAGSLERAKKDFSAQGWSDYMKTMTGFVDAKGAPTFNSSFVASGSGVLVGEENGIAHVTIPGKLTQIQNQSRTVYDPIVIDVRVDEKQMKIEHLEQVYKLH